MELKKRKNITTFDQNEFGRRCETIRKKLCLTQTELARELGTTQHMISKIENGNPVLSKLLLSLLFFFSKSVSLDKFFDPNFDLLKDDIVTNTSSLNSIVKAKMKLLKEETDKILNDTRKNIAQQIDDATTLL
ncbi:helix-turn-helix domain-containing protein [Segatella oulorum]|jgi:Helix-turn-helix.|nr:helix-turn-helix transcriptional regulator [Segatella oulorum]